MHLADAFIQRLLTHPSAHTHLEQWAADAEVSREQLGVISSHLSRGQFLPEPRFEPTTSGYKSNALAIRAMTARFSDVIWPL